MRFRSRLGLRKIHLRAHLGLDIAPANHRLQNIQDAPGVELFELLHILQLLGIRPAGRTICGRREQFAGVIEHTHRGRGHLGNAGRHQMHDAGELVALQAAPRMQAHQHRRRGFLLLAEKAVLVRQGQMHSRTLHRGQGLNGTCQFAFQPTLKGQALLELGHPETVRLHHLKTGDRAFRQT